MGRTSSLLRNCRKCTASSLPDLPANMAQFVEVGLLLSHYNTCLNVFHAKDLKASVADSFAVDTCKKMASVALSVNITYSGK
ncbi:hypothetical protein [Nitrosarchaeum sp. AC2]|uniref:hypothetical protein n=1 Tax=Nitrosarchaeum sp. AC2 TaxID=2259673 RepID=UPI0015C741E0|nr:hypothetical protein [Nitrosarchaeum sp. AC2]